MGGRRVRIQPLGVLGVGEHQARWNGRDDAGKDVSSGVYFARVSGAGAASAMEKIVLVR